MTIHKYSWGTVCAASWGSDIESKSLSEGVYVFSVYGLPIFHKYDWIYIHYYHNNATTNHHAYIAWC